MNFCSIPEQKQVQKRKLASFENVQYSEMFGVGYTKKPKMAFLSRYELVYAYLLRSFLQ